MSATKVDDEKRYQCPFPGCGKSFSSKGNVSRHHREVHDTPRINCEFEYCGRTAGRGFRSRYQYREHLREFHQHEIPDRRRPEPSDNTVPSHQELPKDDLAARSAPWDGLGAVSSYYQNYRPQIPLDKVDYAESYSERLRSGVIPLRFEESVDPVSNAETSKIDFEIGGVSDFREIDFGSLLDSDCLSGFGVVAGSEAYEKAHCERCRLQRVQCSQTRPRCDECAKAGMSCSFETDIKGSDSNILVEAGTKQSIAAERNSPDGLVEDLNHDRDETSLSDRSAKLADQAREEASLPANLSGRAQDPSGELLPDTKDILAESDRRADEQTATTDIQDVAQVQFQASELKTTQKLDDPVQEPTDLKEGLAASPLRTAFVDVVPRVQTSFQVPNAPTTQAPHAPAKQLPQFEHASWKNFFHKPDSPTKGGSPRRNDEEWQLPYLQVVDLSKAQEESTPAFTDYSRDAKLHGQDTPRYPIRTKYTPALIDALPSLEELGVKLTLSSPIESDHGTKNDVIGGSSTDQSTSVIRHDTTQSQDNINTLALDELRARIPTIPQGETDQHRILKEASSYIQFLQRNTGTREARDMALSSTPESLLGNGELPSVRSYSTDGRIEIQPRQVVVYDTLFPLMDPTLSYHPPPGIGQNHEDFALFPEQGDTPHPQSEKAITENSQPLSLDGEFTKSPSSDSLQEESDSSGDCTSVIVNDCGFNIHGGEVWKGSWNIYEASDVSLKDRLQLQAEKYTACEWNWWPLQSPRLRPRAGFLGLSYQCQDCTSIAHFEVPEEVARRLSPSQWLKDHIHGATDRPTGGSSTMTEEASGSAAQMSGSSSSPNTIKLRGRNDQPTNQPTSNQVSTSNPSITPNPAPSSTNYSTFILLCYGSLPPKYRTIKIQKGFRDRLLMRGIQAHLRDMMGWFKFYFYWEGFGWCDFLEFRCLNKLYLEKLRPGIPDELDGAYVFDPRPPKHNPPISKQGWRMRYYHCKCVEGNDRTVRQIPKRKLDFFDALDDDDDEVLYGLDIQLEPLLWRVLAWQAVILAGPLAFWIYWLTTHDGDWQNATALMLVTIALTESCFLIPLNGHFRN